MNEELLPALQKAELAVREDLLRQYYADEHLMSQARERLRAEESSVADVDAWLITFAGRAATVYVLKSLYVRVLEDQGLFVPQRIRESGTYPLFAELFPNLGIDAYLQTVYDDAYRVLPELFTPTPVEIAQPSAAAAQVVWAAWQERRADGEAFFFGGELDTRFIGDLYQELDPQVKDRYALLQTPQFVESFILDYTLEPALQRFPLEGFRLLDPTCGSGHFLLGAFERLAKRWREALGDERDPQVRWEATLRALASVSGVDLNDYASALTRFRLLLGVVRETGVRDPARLTKLHFDVITCDALIPWETLAKELPLERARDTSSIDQYGPDDERDRNVAFFARPFHAVVGNPPYKAIADREKREKYHELWPRSATGRYSLSAPMTERFCLLPIEGGRAGFITSNNFAKRSFGRGLITKVLRDVELVAVVDTAGAYIPGHGTPTVIFFSTRRKPDLEGQVRVVIGKRGETGVPQDPAHAPVWSAIVEHVGELGYEDPWIAVSEVPQATLCSHPWSLGSDSVTAVKAKLDAFQRIQDLGAEAGFAVIIAEDDAFFRRYSRGLPLKRVIVGEDVRDWAIRDRHVVALRPYNDDSTLVAEEEAVADLWPLKSTLSNRPLFSGMSYRAEGVPWWKYHQVTSGRGALGLHRLVIAEIGTSSHFVYDASDGICTRTAPVLVVRGGDAALHKDIAAVLNSSTLEFWFKQVCFPKGDADGRTANEPYERRYVRNGTNVVQAPYDTKGILVRDAVVAEIERTVSARYSYDPATVLAESSADEVTVEIEGARSLDEDALARLVFLQEELDWIMYERFGLVANVPKGKVTAECRLHRGHRPFEVALARRVARGEEQTKWFERDGLKPVTEVPAEYDEDFAAVLRARLTLIESDETVGILEQPIYKRRWTEVSWGDRVRSASTAHLADALEAILCQSGPSQPLSLNQLTKRVASDEKLLAIASLLGASADSLGDTLGQILDENAVADSPSRLFKQTGLQKLVADAVSGNPDRAAQFEPGSATNWKGVWRLQEREDRGELIEPMPAAPPFKPVDYAQPIGWKLRGKFNVPNERFIVYDDIQPKRYGWGGWTIAERARASLEIFQLRNDQDRNASERPLDDPSRCPVQFALWDKLDELRRTHDPLEPQVRSLAEICGARCPCPILLEWRESTSRSKKTNGTAPQPVREPALETPLDPELVAAVHARIRAAGEQGSTASNLLVAASGDTALLKDALAALRARGDVDVVGRGKRTRYIDPREVQRLAKAEMALL